MNYMNIESSKESSSSKNAESVCSTHFADCLRPLWKSVSGAILALQEAKSSSFREKSRNAKPSLFIDGELPVRLTENLRQESMT